MKAIVTILLTIYSLSVQSSCVILLHGLARSDHSMEKLASELSKHDFTVLNVDYPSTEHPIEVLADNAISPALTQCPADQEINFVTHSMGGILVRYYLANHNLERLHRVVMLGPPNQGSEIVDKLSKVPGFYFINGDAGMQLGTGELSVPNRLGRANFDVGIIAGTRSINWFLSSIIPNTDDGKVSVQRTKLDGMSDHLAMPVTHPFMMNNAKVIDQVIFYLENGGFKR